MGPRSSERGMGSSRNIQFSKNKRPVCERLANPLTGALSLSTVSNRESCRNGEIFSPSSNHRFPSSPRRSKLSAFQNPDNAAPHHR